MKEKGITLIALVITIVHYCSFNFSRGINCNVNRRKWNT